MPPHGWQERAQRAVAKGQLIDAFIPGILLDSAFSRLGYWYACALGWAWGTIWSTGKVEKRGELWVFRGLPRWAFPRGGVCIGHCYLTGSAYVTARVLRHEAIHVAQWQRYGFLMPLLSAISGRDPLQNRFEIEAGLEDGNYVPRGTE